MKKVYKISYYNFIMTKKKVVSKKSMSLIELIIAPFYFKMFDKKEISKKISAIYSVVLLFLTIIVSLLINNIGNYPVVDNSTLFYLNLGGMIVITLVLYLLLYIFLNSFLDTRKPFFESLLVTTSLLYPFIFLGNLLNYLGQLSTNIGITFVLFVLMLLVTLYAVISYIICFKKYYETSIFKVLSSVILTLLVLSSMVIMSYLNYLISILR
jgi:hypothetical protein